MDLNTLLLFIATETLLSLSPGPAVLLVIGLALRHSFKISFAASLGIIATNAFYFTLAALGVGAVILASVTLFTIIKWVGAAYLVWLGLQMQIPMKEFAQNIFPNEQNCFQAARRIGRNTICCARLQT